LAQGDRVILLDNFNDYYSPARKRRNIADLLAHPQAILVEADIRDAGRMEQVVNEHKVDRICHLAALANVRASVEHALEYLDNNTMGTVNLMEAGRKRGIEMFVLASTSSVYGNDSPVPFVETAPADHPLASYPASKRAAELMGHTYWNLFKMPVTALRFFNVYGPSGRPDMMPLKVIEALLERKSLTLFDGGSLQRDWTFIDDTVSGVVAALEKPLGYEVINLGFGAPSTLNQFIAILEELTGRTAITEVAPAPPTEPQITYCDNGKARRLLGFDPTTSLVDGLAQTWDWFRSVMQRE
jgi:UDP-glucuronate 4-epimerase